MDAVLLQTYLAVPHLAMTVWIPASVAVPTLAWSWPVWSSRRSALVLAASLCATAASGRWESNADGSLAGLHLVPLMPVVLICLWLRDLQAGAGEVWMKTVAAICAWSWLSILFGDVIQSIAVGQDLFYIGGSGLTDTLLLAPGIALLGTISISLAARAKALAINA